MANEKFTDLPTVANATAADIICAVQSGVSVQETLQQVLNLSLSQTVLNFAGNPNGNVAGVTYQLLWDTTDNLLWVCTTTGSAASAVWKLASGIGNSWITVTTTSQQMDINGSYITNNSSLVTLTLPPVAGVGSPLNVIGLGSGGWKIAQNAGQNIQIGSGPTTTTGTGGSIASTNRYDSVELICIVANTTWATLSGPQSAGLTIV